MKARIPAPPLLVLLRNPALLLAFGLGSGCAKWAPGTWGTLAALPFGLLLMQLPIWAHLSSVLLASLLGIWLCRVASEHLQVHDHSGIVWDEFVGLWITFIALPQGWWWPVIGFVVFRLFDIVKPWPISWLDRHIHGGLGIMIDDILAGIMAWACVQGLVWYLA